jgi:hypothetical protein
MLLLLTGARRRQITQAKWQHVDWEKRVLLVPCRSRVDLGLSPLTPPHSRS